MPTVYTRIRHAAHYGHGLGGHDLERWEVIQEWDELRPEEVPADAEKSYGFMENGQQHVFYVRIAELTPYENCPTCKGAP
jgi:hypothetical protein